jgi:hypothetical protein
MLSNQSTTSDLIQSASRSGKRQRSQLTRVAKIQRASLILGRIYNPFNDSTASMALAIFLLCPLNPCSSSSVIPIFISSLALILPSVGYEIYSSLKLSKESPFVHGQSDTRQLIILQDELNAIMGPEVANYSLVKLVNYPSHKHNPQLIRLVKDFQQVRQYNHVRKLAEILNVALLTEGTLNWLFIIYFRRNEILPDKKFFDFPEIDIIFPVIAIFFILKSLLHHIEYRWEYYEPAWRGLPLYLKKILVRLRDTVDLCYDVIFALNRLGLGICGIMGVSYGLIHISPVVASYVATQQIPSHKPTFDRKFIHYIKRFNQTLVNGAGIGGLLLFSLSIAYSMVYSRNEILMFLPFPIFILIAALGGMTMAINTWVNYQERDSKKLTVVEDEVQALRQALLNEGHASHSYGAVASVETPSSNDFIPKSIANKSKTHESCSWLPFWRSSSRKDPIAAQTLSPTIGTQYSTTIP